MSWFDPYSVPLPYDMFYDTLITIFQSVMGAVTAALAEVWAAISQIFINVANIIYQLFRIIGRGLAYSLEFILNALSSAAGAVADVFIFVASGALGGLIDLGKFIVWHVALGITLADYYISEIVRKFKRLLEIIHFKTILKVHKILMLVSPQYRDMMKKVYNKIQGISEAVGLGTHFITLALRNSRNLVLDLTTTFGGKYDLAEVQWLDSLKHFLDNVDDKIEGWQNDPEAFFFDLGQLIDKPAMDAKGAFLSDVWITIDNILDEAVRVGEQVGKVSADLYELIGGLPAFIRENIPKELYDGIATVEVKINDLILPKLREVDNLTSKYAAEAKEIKARIQAAINSILSPKETLKKIGEMEGADRDMVAAIFEEYRRTAVIGIAGAIGEETADELAEFAATIAAPYPETPTPTILTYEVDVLEAPEVPVVPGKNTPFVGEF